MLQGLEVSLLGIFVTFLALGVFILIMVVLQRLFPSRRRESRAPEPMAEAAPPPVVETAAADEEEGAVVAAIAAALSVLRAQEKSSLGASLEEGRGGWWVARRAEARMGKVEK